MSFDDLNLNKPLRQAIDEAGFAQPTPIQVAAFPAVMSGRDVVGIAQTGTGKTLAFLLPLLRLHSFNKSKDPRVAILAPTRELVVQIAGEVEKLAKYMDLRVVPVYGGTNIRTQKKAVGEGVDIIVGTPERFYDIAISGVFKTQQIKKLVLDEVDVMLDMGFRPQVKNCLDLLPEKRQNLLFSATMTPEVEAIIDEYFFGEIQTIEITPTGTPVEKIDQYRYDIDNFESKANLLEHLLVNRTDELSKVLIFIRSKRHADLLFERLQPKLSDSLGVMHGNKSQNYRLRMIEQFETGTLRALIATDLVSRGVDIDEVSHVVNFDLPDDPIDYIHRIGRTGRADRRGVAISFVEEDRQEDLAAIETLMNRQLQPLIVPEAVELSDELHEWEREAKAGDKHYRPEPKLAAGGGAFHQKLEKNQKVNRAEEKRRAFRQAKRKFNKRKKKR